jgi:FkbM family methyltransferase
VLTVSRFGITSRFDTSPWADTTPTLYRPFLNNEFYEQAFLDHIRSLGLRGVYVDAGSCLGTHTVWFALYCDSTYVHAFDPRERCAQWTQMNVDANDLRHKVTVHKLGLSDAKGEATSLLDGVQEVFPVARLDRVIRAWPQRRGGDRRVVVIKADVEGMEEVVLRGAKGILKRHRPVVFAEAWTKQERAAVAALLAPYGYRATGRVFNSTPTYEFVPRPPERLLRRVAKRLPKLVRRVIFGVRDRVFPRRRRPAAAAPTPGPKPGSRQSASR